MDSQTLAQESGYARQCGSLTLTQIIMINVLGRPQKDAKTLILTHTLNILPLMYWMDLLDILFLVKCLKDETDTIGIYIFMFISFVKFSTRTGTTKRLKHNYCCTSTSRHFTSIAWSCCGIHYPQLICNTSSLLSNTNGYGSSMGSFS